MFPLLQAHSRQTLLFAMVVRFYKMHLMWKDNTFGSVQGPLSNLVQHCYILSEVWDKRGFDQGRGLHHPVKGTLVYWTMSEVKMPIQPSYCGCYLVQHSNKSYIQTNSLHLHVRLNWDHEQENIWLSFLHRQIMDMTSGPWNKVGTFYLVQGQTT